jgi:DNA sulfur modification protein DndD
MLSLTKLTIEDFGPYRGRQEMTFSREDGVYIVYGPNGRGKTTLHNAFRYALYGEIQGRGRPEQARNLANSEAKKVAGYGAFETVLQFTHGNSAYVLRRRYDESQTPSELTLLERDGTPLSQDDAAKALQIIAPRSVSQFFLFDGELLRQYENLLDEGSEEGTALEEAIERVLGIPIVANAVSDVQEVWRQAEKQMAEQYAAHDETARMAASLTETRAIKTRLQESQADVAARMDKTRERIADLETALRAQQKAERILGQLDQLRAHGAELDTREVVATEALNELSSDLWKAVLSVSAGGRLVLVDAEVAAAEDALRHASASLRDITHLHSSDDCPVCHRTVTGGLKDSLIEELLGASSAEHHAAMEENLAEARRRRSTLQSLTLQDARLVADRDRALRSVRLERDEVREDIAALELQLSEISEDELRRWTSERDELLQSLDRDKERHDKMDTDIRDQDLVIEDFKRTMKRQNVQTDATIELKEQVSQDLVALFEGAIGAYRTKLRNRVEERASEIFRSLASEPDYVGLRITDRYGLEIIDSDGDVVRRSAGYEHLVALSLIAALQDSAAVRGPVVMDYPFGRLDIPNTAKVVAALPRMARQVVLLSFEGEFDRAAAVQALGPDLIAEYGLERVSSKHTRIEPRRSEL